MPRIWKNKLEISEVLDNLEKNNKVIATTDKNNVFRSINTKNITMLCEHLENSAKEMERDKVRKYLRKQDS